MRQHGWISVQTRNHSLGPTRHEGRRVRAFPRAHCRSEPATERPVAEPPAGSWVQTHAVIPGSRGGGGNIPADEGVRGDEGGHRLKCGGEVGRNQDIIAQARHSRPRELKRCSGDAKAERGYQANPDGGCPVLVAGGVGHQGIKGVYTHSQKRRRSREEGRRLVGHDAHRAAGAEQFSPGDVLGVGGHTELQGRIERGIRAGQQRREGGA